MARIGRVIAELAPQGTDVDVERLGGAEPVDVPDPRHQVLSRHDAPGIPRQLRQQVELLAGQLQLAPVNARGSRGNVKLEPADDERLLEAGAAGLAASQHRADPGDHLGAAEGLDHVVVGAHLEADDAVELGPAGGQHHDRHVRVAPQRSADVTTVAVGKRQVQEDEVRLDALRQLERLGGGPGHHGLEALAFERLRERGRDRLLVLDEEDHAPSALAGGALALVGRAGGGHAGHCSRGFGAQPGDREKLVQVFTRTLTAPSRPLRRLVGDHIDQQGEQSSWPTYE